MSETTSRAETPGVPARALSGTPFALARNRSAPRDFDGSGLLAGLGEANDLSASLLALLEALGWQGAPYQVAEALPHFVENFDITSFRNVMAVLGYESRLMTARLGDIGPEHTPCLFLPKDRDALVLVAMEPDGKGEDHTLEVFDSAEQRYTSMPAENLNGTAYVFSPFQKGLNAPGRDTDDWFRVVGDRFKGLAGQALGVTFLLNLTGLAVPLFVMAVFDLAIASGSAKTMSYLAIGVGIAVVLEVALRFMRTGIFSFVGARLDNIVGVEVFKKILYLPASLIERAAIGAQVSRIKDFEAVREFITGSAAAVIFELPFTLLFVAAIAYLGGVIALVPVAMLAVSAGIGLVAMPKIAVLAAQAAGAERLKQELTVETLGGMRAIKYTGADATWLARYRDLSGKSALRNFHMAQFSSLLETYSYVVMIGSGFAIVIFGAIRIQASEMTAGALVACLLLAWRELQPLQDGFRSLSRFSEVEGGIGHLNDLMKIGSRRASPFIPRMDQRSEGRVTFDNVSLQYEPDSPPALENASFDIGSGRIVAVLGSNGAGKSTMLKLIAGLYGPDQGSVMIDGRHIGDMSQAELRKAVAYVPQSPQFFYGTIAQNLRLAHPTATDADLRWAARQAGALDDIDAMEQGSGDWKRTGFDVRLGDRGSGQVSPGLLQRLNLARGYLKRAPVVLLDEPGNGLDLKGDKALMQALSNMRGEQTVFIVTHRPSHLKLADRLIWMEYGAIRSVGRPKVVMQKTQGKIL
ncbi:MAG: ATP-binding cassette domain-containing protein [Proteobacteria bacterium]|nr:ATP-binding cassette domain-containing protein [Pseudomonadota bacterium]